LRPPPRLPFSPSFLGGRVEWIRSAASDATVARRMTGEEDEEDVEEEEEIAGVGRGKR
jgi:hypothetical protein